MGSTEKIISVVVMTLNAEKYIKDMLDILSKQTVKPAEIIIADSESTDKTIEIAKSYNLVKILEIKRSEFDHGGSRHLAFDKSVGDFVLFFTQDAFIEQKNYIEQIISNFADEKVAMVCGRQKAKPNAVHYERLIREFNYPMQKKVRTSADINTLGIKAFYMSDACSAYRRSAYYDLGGFEYPILTNEDMLIAARALEKGYKTVYDPDAYVLHSHNFTCMQEYKRNFDVAAFMVMHEEVFRGININGEGMKLVKYVSKDLLKHLHFLSFIQFGFICVAKFAGNRKGHDIRSMNLDSIKKHSSLPGWWKNV